MREIISEKIVSELGFGLDWAAKRQRTIANNIANVDTAGYKRRDVTFPETLTQAAKNQDKELSLMRTHERHLLPSTNEDLSTTVHMGTSHRNDGNNVDIELETAELAKNSLYYNALIERVGGHFRNLRMVISEGRR